MYYIHVGSDLAAMEELKHILFEEYKVPYNLQMLTAYEKACIISHSKDKIR